MLLAKYAWIKPLNDKKAKTVLLGFIEIVNESKRKPNKLWVDQGKEFYNNSDILGLWGITIQEPWSVKYF